MVVVTMLSSAASSKRLAERLVKEAVDGTDERGIGLERLLNRVEQLLLLLGVDFGSGRLLRKHNGEAADLEALASLGRGEVSPELGDLDVRREGDVVLVLVGVYESGGGGRKVESVLDGGGEGLEGGDGSGGEGEKTRSGVVGELERVGRHLGKTRRVSDGGEQEGKGGSLR